jgi:hypothetical protein
MTIASLAFAAFGLVVFGGIAALLIIIVFGGNR